MSRKEFKDPMEYLEFVMNDGTEATRVRMDAAKTLMPYKYAKLGELGKKEQKQQQAGKASQGRFKPRVVS